MADGKYLWYELMKDMEDLSNWMSEKPKWWQFRKMKIWKMMDPRRYWR